LGDEGAGRWMMRKEAKEGLSPEEIARKYSLPAVPKYITDVNVPAGTSIRTGRVESNFGGNQGAVQYQLLKPIPENSFVNTRPLR
jgi:filamentous hemagglutinin